jgi:enoyl-CoA hydratase
VGATARAIVLTGDGLYFSAGADLKELAALGLDRAGEIIARGQALFSSLEALRPPVIAAINGLAVGGGLELALACDLRVAGESAKLGAPEVNFGLMPAYGGTQRLLRLVGPAKARELVFTGSMIPASEALRIGLVNRTVPSGQELRAARDLAHTIAERAPRAVAGAKRAIVEGADLELAAGLKREAEIFEHEVLPSEDLGEGLQAFLERRPPKFRGV